MFLRNKKLDICFLQETHSTKEIESYWRSEWGGKIWYSHGTSKAKGVAIIFRRGIDIKIHEVDRDDQGRAIVMKIEFEKKIYLLLNVYGPNNDDSQFYKKKFDWIRKFTYDHLIVGGDFNTVLNSEVDRNQGEHKNKMLQRY